MTSKKKTGRKFGFAKEINKIYILGHSCSENDYYFFRFLFREYKNSEFIILNYNFSLEGKETNYFEENKERIFKMIHKCAKEECFDKLMILDRMKVIDLQKEFLDDKELYERKENPTASRIA